MVIERSRDAYLVSYRYAYTLSSSSGLSKDSFLDFRQNYFCTQCASRHLDKFVCAIYVLLDCARST